MGTTEIVLLVIGGLFFVISFFLPDGKKKQEEHVTQAEIKALIDKEMADAKTRIDDMVDETVNYSVEKTERALEKLSNEKIMAVDEYSETVLKKINDNHQEAVFLYDMLNDKDEKLKTTGEELKADQEALKDREQELLLKQAQVQEQERLAKLREEEEKARKEKERIEEEEKKKAEEEAKLKEQQEADAFKPLEPEVVEVENGVAVATKKTRKASSKAKNAKTDAADEEIPSRFESDRDGRQNSNEQIIRLHKEGKSNMAIAKELGLGVGEVKLVIDLFVSKNK